MLSPLSVLNPDSTHRDESDKYQAILRLCIGGVVFLYVVYLFGVSADVSTVGGRATIACIAYLLFAGAQLFWLKLHPGSALLRRILGMSVDILATTYGLMVAGEAGSVFFPLYLWLIIGNGIRFGERFLFGGALLSAAAFALVLTQNAYWIENRYLGGALFVSLLAIPAFVAILLRALRRARDTAEAISKAKTEFFTNISRQIKGPLNGVIGVSDLLKGTQLNRKQRDWVETIDASAATVLDLIDKVIDISRLESGELNLDLSGFDLKHELRRVAHMFRPQAATKGLGFQIVVDPALPRFVKGDPFRLRQVLANLTSNAIKFTQEGKIRLAVKRMDAGGSGAQVRFEISDSGIGMTKDAQDRVFERFMPTDQRTTMPFAGAGLGAAIAKELVELMGGEIGVRSDVGVGTTFWFELQFDYQPEAREGLSELTSQQPTRALIIGSAAREVEAISGFLRGWDIEVEHAMVLVHGFERLLSASLHNLPFDVVVIIGDDSDLSTPQIRALLRQDAHIREPLFIRVLEHESLSDTAVGADLDGHVVLGAPVNKSELFRAINMSHLSDWMEEVTPNLVDFQKAAQASREDRSGPLEILVAEDNVTNQTVITKMLEQKGHRVTVAENGEIALDALAHQRFDLFLVDLHMPDMSGYDVVKLYRLKHSEDGQTLPIVALTADTTIEARTRCALAGLDGVLYKPVRPRELDILLDSLDLTPRSAPRVSEFDAVVTTDEVKEPAVADELGDGEDFFDIEVLRDLERLEDDDEFIIEFLGTFMSESRRLIDQIQQAAQQCEVVRFRDAIHALKGSAANVGAKSLSECCGILQEIDAEQFLLNRTSYMDEVAREYARAREYIKAYLQQYAA